MFAILFDGKPLSIGVYATFDGFSTNPDTYAYFTETDEQGIAKVKIMHQGIWMVRVEKELSDPTEDYDRHTISRQTKFFVYSEKPDFSEKSGFSENFIPENLC